MVDMIIVALSQKLYSIINHNVRSIKNYDNM